ncbi:GyrI-like domain-containing protein [Vibrio sonorensis]|uniref:GyrI-like domain-containing protein n=1 Tax=Vibrio sonorensis TaxID=1004316 RepID=UPI0008DA9273|nr:GyrI-like domain-containing protein [Vibrio sonorensis]
MKIEQIKGFLVHGLTVETKNHDEFNGQGKIAPLWQDFYTRAAPTLPENSNVYGVYHSYESDFNGQYSVTAGADTLKDQQVTGCTPVEVKDGTYAIFEAEGAMPAIVVDLWGEIWNYFSQPDCPHQRSFTTDFEHYTSAQSVKIYIALESK